MARGTSHTLSFYKVVRARAHTHTQLHHATALLEVMALTKHNCCGSPALTSIYKPYTTFLAIIQSLKSFPAGCAGSLEHLGQKDDQTGREQWSKLIKLHTCKPDDITPNNWNGIKSQILSKKDKAKEDV